jgi:hypothetical protein
MGLTSLFEGSTPKSKLGCATLRLREGRCRTVGLRAAHYALASICRKQSETCTLAKHRAGAVFSISVLGAAVLVHALPSLLHYGEAIVTPGV